MRALSTMTMLIGLLACGSPAPTPAPTPTPPAASASQEPAPSDKPAAAPAPAEPTAKRPASRRAVLGDRLGLLGVECPASPPADTQVHCNIKGNVVIVEAPVDVVPAIPAQAEILIDRAQTDGRRPSVTVALDGERLWIRRVTCATCRRILGRTTLAWLGDLDRGPRERLGRALGIPSAGLATAAQWRDAIKTHVPAPFDKLGAACPAKTDNTMVCGKGKTVSQISMSRGFGRVPLRAEMLVNRVSNAGRGSVNIIALDGDTLWLESVRCTRCASMPRGHTTAIRLTAMTAAQRTALHKRLGLTGAVPTDAAGWRKQILARGDAGMFP